MAPILDPKFCSKCAAPMARKIPASDHRERHVCTICGFIHYLDPKVACGTVPERDGRIALIKRDLDPRKGFWSFPCGFMEIDETVEETAARETLEETGLSVELGAHLGTFSYTETFFGGSIVVVVFASKVVSGQLQAGDDAGEARWYLPSEVPWDQLAFRSSHAGLREYFRRRGIDLP